MKNRHIASCFYLTIFYLFAYQAYATDETQGKKLHDTNCTSCHISLKGGDGSSIYTREDRKIGSLTGLDRQVRRCKNSLGTNWPEDQINAVVNHLNNQFYKFPK